MWKLIIGFLVFAAIALFVLMRGGDIDMSGEKHGTETTHEAPAAAAHAPAASAPATAPATAPAAAASGAK